MFKKEVKHLLNTCGILFLDIRNFLSIQQLRPKSSLHAINQFVLNQVKSTVIIAKLVMTRQ